MISVVLFVLGVTFGSFVNALVWRIHEQEKPSTKTKKAKTDLSIVHGRSVCVHCQHILHARDLLPILSWLELRGRCRYCKKSISWQYPLVELITGFLFVVTYLWWPLEFDGRGQFMLIVWLGYIVGLVALTVYDLRWLILPNRIIYPMLVVALLVTAIDGLVFSVDAKPVRDAVLGLLVGGGLFYLIFVVSKGRWIGGGDVKLGFFMGLALGPSLAFLAIFLASAIGSVVSITLLATKKINRQSQIPFGPYLIAGTWVAMLFGQIMIDWYLDQILLDI